MTNVDIVCHGCGTRGSWPLAKIATVACATCRNSDNIDLFEKEAASPGTGWTETRPNILQGWDEYQGPAVHPNPEAGAHLDGDPDAYSDLDWERGNPGYNPGGGYSVANPGNHVGPTTGIPPIEQWDLHRGPDSGGARWQGRSASRVPLHVTLPNGTVWEGEGHVVYAGRPSKDPFGSVEDHLKGTKYSDPDSDNYRAPEKPQRSDRTVPLKNVQCPSCGNSETVVTTHQGDGWWHCQKCGSLANIDKTNVDPYAPPFAFKPDRSGPQNGKAAKVASGQPAQVIRIMSAIRSKNSGLNDNEVLNLARAAVRKYGDNN